MKKILTQITTLIEALSNLVFATMVVFMLILLLSPLINLLRGHTGLGWIRAKKGDRRQTPFQTPLRDCIKAPISVPLAPIT